MDDGQVCTGCNTPKVWAEFYEDKHAVTGHRTRCKVCWSAASKKWREEHPNHDKEYSRQWRKDNPDKHERLNRTLHLRHKYGLTIEDQWRILAEQDGRCATCPKLLTVFGTGLDDACIDHNHITKRIRGVLCGACNRALGFLNDSISTARSLIIYLEKDQTGFEIEVIG